MGRKTKLTPELIEQASKLVAAGNYLKHVAQYLGIPERTFYRWLAEGEKAKKGLAWQFYQAIKKAEAEAVARNIALIQKAATEGNWQAAAWWLERKYPEEWGRKDRMNMQASGGLTIRIVEVGEAENADGDPNQGD